MKYLHEFHLLKFKTDLFITLIGLMLIVLVPAVTSGQNKRAEFGKINPDELNMQEYQADKAAGAVVLSDYGKSFFVRSDEGFEVIFERQTRVKILKESGMQYSEIEIPFYREGDIFEKIYDLSAFSYNLDQGKLVKKELNLTDCHDEKLNEYWHVRKFALPDVKPGTVIEYKYSIISQYIFNLRDWEFQWRIPVVYSCYQVHMIPFYEYSWLLQGANKFDSQRVYEDQSLPRTFMNVTFDDLVNEFVMLNVPAFGDEKFISSFNDYVIKIDFQLAKVKYPNGAQQDVLTTWPELVKNLVKHGDFGRYAARSEKVSADLMDLVKVSKLSESERFDTILSYIKNHFNWNGTRSKYASKTPSEFVKDKFGNSAEINLFCIGMLRAAGIEAYPVLLSTRDNGRIKVDFPFVRFFNYVAIAAMIDGSMVLSDATAPLVMNRRLPARCLNDKGLIIKELNTKEDVSWVNLECRTLSETRTVIRYKGVKETFEAGVELTATEYDASELRAAYHTDNEKFLEPYQTDLYEIAEQSVVTEQINGRSPKSRVQYNITGKAETIDNKLYLDPFLGMIIKNSPLTASTRTYPVDMIYPRKKAYFAMVPIPEGYEVDYLPQDNTVANDVIELSYTARPTDGGLMISFIYSFLKPVYAASDYSRLKYYFNSIVNLGNEKIVFARKKD